jgi:hypothetical protein
VVAFPSWIYVSNVLLGHNLMPPLEFDDARMLAKLLEDGIFDVKRV